MRPFGLYIHIPFCDGKCYYCNFFSVRQDPAKMDGYTDHLKRIMRTRSKDINRPISSVYFGGGTPSLLGHDRLTDIIGTAKACFDIAPDAEITLEVNPSSTALLDFHALKGAGFNRLSIGMQSANFAELKILGRRHNIEDVINAVISARSAGFDNISLDVMIALPAQTEELLKGTLDFCAEMDAQHISCYILKVEEGTRYYYERDRVHFYDDEEQARFYEFTVNRLKELGYEQYEISNFSRPGYESRHNLLYWHDEEYLGLGPSAHSFIDGRRFCYPNSFESFYADETEYEGAGGDREEYIMLALRLSEGLIFARYRERYNEDLSDSFMNAARELCGHGLAEMTPSSLSLTVKGFLVSNSVISYLIERL